MSLHGNFRPRIEKNILYGPDKLCPNFLEKGFQKCKETVPNLNFHIDPTTTLRIPDFPMTGLRHKIANFQFPMTSGVPNSCEIWVLEIESE